MGFNALDGIENLGKKRVPPKRPEAKQVVLPPEPEPTIGEPVIVRVPRTTPAAKQKAVNRVESAEANSGAMVATGRLGVQQETQLRRQDVLSWMLNGHLHAGELMSIQQLAESLNAPLKTVERDVASLKEKMANYHIEADSKDVPALAYMLMEMKFQDRGRALALYNIIIQDIQEADDNILEVEDKRGNTKKLGALTGRDRAAMYNAALQAMDLANKATNGMDSLFKMTGGAQKLQNIIKAKQVILQQGGQMIVQQTTLQEFAAKELAGVLPSVRKHNDQLALPPGLTITAEDEKIMEIAEKERKGR